MTGGGVTALQSNHPNPFNASTRIPYRLASPGPVRLVIFNALGQPVRTLVDEFQVAGPYVVPWDGRDDRGRRVANGAYLYRLQAGAQVQVRRDGCLGIGLPSSWSATAGPISEADPGGVTA